MPLAAQAEVKAKDPWVRGTVPAQKTTGFFVTLTSTEEARLVGAATPAARRTEIHQSSMEGGVMRMRAVESVRLPAGKAVALEPGGYHVMLIGLAAPLAAGATVPVTLAIEGRGGKRSSVEVRAEVRPLGAR